MLTGQQIRVDDVVHDSGRRASIDEVDAWVAGAKHHPVVLGTPASEFVSLYRELGQLDRDLIVVCTSKHIIGSYNAAAHAALSLETMPAFRDVRVSVVDSTLTDLGAGMLTLFCAESVRRGHGRPEVAAAAELLGKAGRMYLIPRNFDHLIKSGKASFLKGMAATLLGKLPIIASQDGQLRSIGLIPKDGDLPQALLGALAKDYPLRRSLFIGITHAKHRKEADELEALLREHYDVKCLLRREFAPAVYIGAGLGLGLCVLPADGLPWPVDLPSETADR